jgi:uncharacterized protein (TIGR01777 family)
MRMTYRAELADHAPETVFAWHERPGALERLTPPWADIEVVSRDGGIRDGGKVVLRIHRGPATFRWEVRHHDYVFGRQFRDEQTSGPLKSWRHMHRFSPLDNGGTLVEDEMEFELPLGPAGAALQAAIGPGLLNHELQRLFEFRYRRLFTDLARHAEHADRPKLTVAITGASGLIGSDLRTFLTTGGHEVVSLVRDSRKLGDGTIYWNPAAGEIDAEGLARADAVVHLAGTSIGAGRWNDDRKRAIRQSRLRGTELLAKTLAELSSGPKVLISASMVDIYGNRGGERLDESASPGAGFLASLCREWEAATRPAERAGVRVVHLRAGKALSPAGGLLGQMLLPFKMGAGGRLGSGEQYLSWIDLDDLVAIILHALYDEGLSGALNATAPHPVTNSTFTSALGRVLGRPTLIPVPALAVKAAFGELGTASLLWGQRAVPKKALGAGFSFFYEGVEDSLRFQLGRQE